MISETCCNANKLIIFNHLVIPGFRKRGERENTKHQTRQTTTRQVLYH